MGLQLNGSAANGLLCLQSTIKTFVFALQNDFTPEEEEEVRKENQWAFE